MFFYWMIIRLNFSRFAQICYCFIPRKLYGLGWEWGGDCSGNWGDISGNKWWMWPVGSVQGLRIPSWLSSEVLRRCDNSRADPEICGEPIMLESKLFIEQKLDVMGQSNSIPGKVLALHIAELCSICGTSYGPQSPCKSWVPPGVAPKQISCKAYITCHSSFVKIWGTGWYALLSVIQEYKLLLME